MWCLVGLHQVSWNTLPGLSGGRSPSFSLSSSLKFPQWTNTLTQLLKMLRYHTYSNPFTKCISDCLYLLLICSFFEMFGEPPSFVYACQPVDWVETVASLQVDRTVEEVEWAEPGSAAGMNMLESFIDLRLKHFATHRNDPNSAAISQLSPWIRFGRWSIPPAACFPFRRLRLCLRQRLL